MDTCILSNGDTVLAMHPKKSLSLQGIMIKLKSHLQLEESISSFFLASQLLRVFDIWYLQMSFPLIHLFPVFPSCFFRLLMNQSSKESLPMNLCKSLPWGIFSLYKKVADQEHSQKLCALRDFPHWSIKFILYWGYSTVTVYSLDLYVK